MKTSRASMATSFQGARSYGERSSAAMAPADAPIKSLSTIWIYKQAASVVASAASCHILKEGSLPPAHEREGVDVLGRHGMLWCASEQRAADGTHLPHDGQ